MPNAIGRRPIMNRIPGGVQHSAVSKVQLTWSPGQGVRPRPGAPVHQAGLYLSAMVKSGHDLQIDKVSMNKTTKTVTIDVDGRGRGPAGKTSARESAFVSGGFGAKAQQWTVVVRDGGKVIATKKVTLGGPPAP